MTADIVIPVFNQREYTKQCLSTLLTPKSTLASITVINNASTDGTAAFLAEQQNITTITNSQNRGCAAAWNQGVKAGTAPWVVVLNNDVILPEGFATNNSGGILAGISNGDAIVARVAVKPIPSIGKEQQTINLAHEPVTVSIGGRHDISAIPRIIPVCEAMVALTLADHLLRQKAIA